MRTKNKKTRLQKVLDRYEKELKNSEVDENALENYYDWVSNHPGCNRLQWVTIRQFSVGEFLKLSKTSCVGAKELDAIADLYAAVEADPIASGFGSMAPVRQQSYDPFQGIDLPENLEREWRLKYNERLESDLKQCTEGKVTVESLLELEGQVSDMELDRNKILAVASLIAPNKPFSENDGKTLQQLSQMWINLEKKVSKFNYNEGTLLGNLTFAANELKQAMKKPDANPIIAKNLPTRLLFRSRDYLNTGNREKRIPSKNPEATSFEDEPEENLPRADIDIEQMTDLTIMLNKLSTEEREILKKQNEGIPLADKERQRLKRARDRLKKSEKAKKT